MTSTGAAGAPVLDVIPLGGLGEFGMNMMLVACGDTAVLIDAGVMFPEPELFGVDLVIPDLDVLDPYRGRIRALVLTHGHEDHIGAVAHVIDRIDGPVYGTRFTLALVRAEARGARHRRRRAAGPRGAARRRVTVGPFRIEFLRVTHSMPDCVAVAIHTPAGTIVHTGDFKIDQTPLDGEPFDLHRFAELGASGVLALLLRQHERRPPRLHRLGARRHRGLRGDLQQRDRQDRRRRRFRRASTGCSCSSTWPSSSTARSRSSAAACSRRRRSPMRLGYLTIPPGLQIRDADVRDYPAEDVVCLCTGSQGEPLAALPRIAIDDHQHVQLDAGDVVVFSARVIPGNEKAIGRVMNHVARRGAEVIADGQKARPRLRPRQRRRAETGPFPGQAAVLRADTWGVPATGPARPHGDPRLSRRRRS